MKKILMIFLSVFLIVSLFIVPVSALEVSEITPVKIESSYNFTTYEYYSIKSQYSFYALYYDELNNVYNLHFGCYPNFGSTGDVKLSFETEQSALNFLQNGDVSGCISYVKDSSSPEKLLKSYTFIASLNEKSFIAPSYASNSNYKLPSSLVTDPYRYYVYNEKKPYYDMWEDPLTGYCYIKFSPSPGISSTGDFRLVFKNVDCATKYLARGSSTGFLYYSSSGSFYPNKTMNLVASHSDDNEIKPAFSPFDKISPEAYSGVLNQVVSLLPVCLAVLIGYIGLRKSISFLRGVMFNA